MNVLPLVISLLMIFSIFTSTLLVKKKNSDIANHFYSGYFNAQREINNLYHRDFYKSIKAKSRNPKNKLSPSQNSFKKANEIAFEDEENKKFRDVDYLNAKMNIVSIFTSDNKELYELTASLIRHLYEKKSFYYEKLEYILLDQMKKSAKEYLKDNKINEMHLSKLDLKEANLQLIYYKILKGSKFYNYHDKIGKASLLDFVEVCPNDLCKMPIRDISFEILSIIFNEKIARAINLLQIENPPENLTYENINAICLKHNFKMNNQYLKYIDFSDKNHDKKNYAGKDLNGNIIIKKTFN